MNMKPKVVILCGGRGSRMEKETEYIPKPLLKVGGKPIIWHIMKTYAHYGFNEFILCLGYKGNKIKKYFLNYETINSNFTLNMKTGWIEYKGKAQNEDWKIAFVDTGENAQTGARVKKVEEYVDSDTFMLTYGDGVADINIKELLKFHIKHKKIGTVTGVQPLSKFGELTIDLDVVTAFSEKQQVRRGFINGGFFVFNRKFFEYLNDADDCILEKYPLKSLAIDEELDAYLHKGFWQCMDTQREMGILNDLWDTGKAKWRVWK